MQYLCPQLIKEGRLCWLRSPLHIVDNNGKKSYYYTDEEFDKVKNTIKGEVTRAKGLGELDDDVIEESMFNMKNQRMDIMEYSDEAISLLYDLMGVDVEPRREYVFGNIDFSKIRE